jgi:small subunit ribosomal protein S27Ae
VIIMAKGKEAKRSAKEGKKPEAKPEAAPVEAKPVEAPVEAKEEKKAKKEKKSQKERPRSKKKHTKIQVWKLYEVKGSEIKRKNEPCPRCGPGIFLARYKNRKYCGKCGWAQIQDDKK